MVHSSQSVNVTGAPARVLLVGLCALLMGGLSMVGERSPSRTVQAAPPQSYPYQTDLTFVVVADPQLLETDLQRSSEVHTAVQAINSITNYRWPERCIEQSGWEGPCGGGGEPIATPSGVVLLGDLTHERSYTGSEWCCRPWAWVSCGNFPEPCAFTHLRTFFENPRTGDGYDSELTGVNFPVYMGIGNHDVWDYRGVECLCADCSGDPDPGYYEHCCNSLHNYIKDRHGPAGALPAGAFDETSLYYSWQWQNVHLVQAQVGVGHTEPRVHDGSAWLEHRLAADLGASGRPFILFQHFPYTDTVPSLRTMMQQYNLVGAFNGHGHQNKYFSPGYYPESGGDLGVDSFWVGSLWSDFGLPPTFAIVRVTDEYMTVVFAELTQSCSPLVCGYTAQIQFPMYSNQAMRFTKVLDHTPPNSSVTLSGSQSNDWYRSDVLAYVKPTDNVRVTETRCALDPSPIPLTFDRLPNECPYVGGAWITEEGEHTLYFASKDGVGNMESVQSMAIRIDKTKPVMTGTPSPLANAAGWNNTPVTVAFTCADSLSGVESESLGSRTINTEGQDQAASSPARCRDRAANEAGEVTVTGINIDWTHPTAVPGGPYVTAEGNVLTLDGTASFDSLSGIASISWETGSDLLFDEGNPAQFAPPDGPAVHSVQLSVVDRAGNQAFGSSLVTVTNVAPTVGVGANVSLGVGEVLSRAGSFADPGTDTWTGKVNYGDGGGTQPLSLVGKTFDLSHAYAQKGSYTLQVCVADDDQGQGCAQATMSVDQSETTTALSSSDNPSLLGQATTFSATVHAQPPGGGTPTGTVTFYETVASGQQGVRAAQSSAVPLVGTTAMLTTTFPTAGVHNIIAAYSGDENYIASVSAALAQNVNYPRPTITRIYPASTWEGGGSFYLIVDGANFVNGSIVRWNGAARETSYTGPTRVMATIPASDLATAATVSVKVVNPGPGGGESNAVTHSVLALLRYYLPEIAR